MIVKNGKRLDIGLDTLPVGTIQPYAGSTPPNGYLKCNGGKVSKNVYPALWNICGDKYGTSTATEFYLPDMSDSNTAEVIWIIKAYYMPPQSSDSESSLETYATKEYVDSAIGDIIIPDVSVFLSKTNTTSYTPTGNYNPATKKYVDDTASNYISKTNTTAFTPTGDYNPATKKYVDDSIPVDYGYSRLYYWDGQSNTNNADNLTLWNAIIAEVKTNGMALVYTSVTNQSSQGLIYVNSAPTAAGTKRYYTEMNSISSVGTSITTYKGYVDITIDSSLNVTAVSALSNTIASYVYNTKYYISSTTAVSTVNTTTYLNTGEYGIRCAASCEGLPVTITEATGIIIETRSPSASPSATYSPYIRQDLYIPSLDRHWYRIVNYAASNNITYGAWKEIDLAFEVVEEW